MCGLWTRIAGIPACTNGTGCTQTHATSKTDRAYLDDVGNTYLIISGPNAIGIQESTGGNAAGT